MPNSRLITNSAGSAYPRIFPERHPVWGLPFSDYFLKDPASAFFSDDRPRPTPEHVKRAAIPHLERLAGHGKPSSETVDRLKDILSLIYTPKELRYLASNTLLNGCIGALRSYSANYLDYGDRDLLKWEFGFLCFRVTLLVVQVSILTRANMLEAFARSQTSAHDPNNISAALSEAASQRILDVAKVPNSRENLFGTFITKDGEEKTTGLWDEGSYGGVPVEFLSRILWRGRREILQICSEVTTTGWSFVILLLKEHLRWALESRECYWPFEWAGIQMLAYRQILIAPSMLEISYLTDICIAGETNRRESAEPLFADAMQDNEDIDVLMTMVIRRMKPSPTIPRLPAKSATPILGWFINYLSFPRKTQLVPSFLEATYLWIWAELVDSATSHPSENEKLYKYASHILYFTSEVFKFHGAPRDRATFTNILVQVEFVNLIGRLLLTPLEIGGFFPSAFTAHISGAKDFLEDWKQLWGYIRRFLGAYDSAAKTSSNQSLVDSYPDWLKIWSCLETHLQAYDQIRSTWGKEWVINCVKLWSDLASAFGYETRPPQEQLRCAYTRCPGTASIFWPEFACECKKVTYCGIRCQHAHWLEPTFEAHRRTCSEIWEDV